MRFIMGDGHFDGLLFAVFVLFFLSAIVGLRVTGTHEFGRASRPHDLRNAGLRSHHFRKVHPGTHQPTVGGAHGRHDVGAVMLRGEPWPHDAEQNETGLDNDLRSSAVCPADSATNA